MRLLCLETATDRGGFALWSGDVLDNVAASTSCESFTCPAGQPHAETLLPALRQALAAFDWSISSLDAIVFDSGPGMFTGLRVSAALAQGLGVALDKPLVPVSSLEVLAESTYAHTGSTQVLTLLDARMNQIYACAWEKSSGNWQALYKTCLVNPDALHQLPALSRPLVASGTGINEYADVPLWLNAQGINDSGTRYPDPAALAYLGALRVARGDVTDPADALPEYVRDRVALTTAERAAGERL